MPSSPEKQRPDPVAPRSDALGSPDPARGLEIDPLLERLADLERRSLLSEQVRQQAHRLRTPLSVIALVAETLQLDLQDDSARSERLTRLQHAATSVASELANEVNATRFGEGPRRSCDVVALAGDVIRAFGGRVRLAPPAADRAYDVLVDPSSVEAAIVHAMRLVGVGTDCNGVSAQRPALRAERKDGKVLLTITADGDAPADTPLERADLRLMAEAARHIASDHGGSLDLCPTSARFRLPAADADRS